MPVEFLGVGIIYLLADAIDVGRQVLPLVREEVAKRDRAAVTA